MKFTSKVYTQYLPIFMFIGVVTLTACNDDDDIDPVRENESIVDIVVRDQNFSTLEAALMKAGLVEALSADGPFTVFAPTNAAFQAAGITALEDYTAEQLREVLLYHVVDGKVNAPNLQDGQEVATLNDTDFYVSLNEGVVINGTTKVTTADVEATNGVVHVIDRVLLPPSQDIVEIAIEAGFSRLAEAVTEAGLVDVLQEDGAFTVFAPTNAAFDALYQRLGVNGPADIDDETLVAVLTYHVLAGRVFSSDLSDGATPTTVQTGTIEINLGDDVTITDKDPGSADAKVTSTDILATNGVIHVIDQILLPVAL
jgi:transforming growth factor-beta-induced protein